MAPALTVFIISYAYSRIIEYFPTGGGGYIVASHTLGEKAGVVSGAALLVDYMLTITVSIVACGVWHGPYTRGATGSGSRADPTLPRGTQPPRRPARKRAPAV